MQYKTEPFVCASQEAKRIKDKRAAGLTLFKSKPMRGIQLLQSSGVMPASAEGTAAWLRSNLAAVDHQALGDLLGSSGEDAIAIMHAYIDLVCCSSHCHEGPRSVSSEDSELR